MLRDLLAKNSDGSGILGDYRVGVLASELPSGFDLPGLLNNDVDVGDPAGTLYRVEIITWPSAGVLTVQENGAFSFTGAPDGTYTGATKVYKNSVPADGTYSFTIGTSEPTVTSVTVTPSTATGSTTFSATVNGTNSPSQAVTWSASAGSITSGGVFTAPAQTSETQVITVTATSVADPTKSGTATVTIDPIRVTPPPFTATRRGRSRAPKRR